jgi:excinuclease UvrABC ATPase subunit
LHGRIHDVLKAFDRSRLLAARRRTATRGLTASHFSFSIARWACEACQGEGGCVSDGSRGRLRSCDHGREALQAAGAGGRYRGRTILQVLDDGPRPDLFQPGSPRVLRRLQVLDRLGRLSGSAARDDFVGRRRSGSKSPRTCRRMAGAPAAYSR